MNVDSLWTTILGEVEIEVSKANFASFFKGTKIKEKEGNLIEVLCPNLASYLMLQSRFYSLIKTHLEQSFKKNISLKFVVATQKLTKEKSGPLFSSQSSIEQTLRKTGLNLNYTFENFAVSESNQMAYAAAQAVASRPGKAYNPLFLWGSVGVGKTHLMQALGKQAAIKNPSLKLIYCTGEEFTNSIIEAIKERSTGRFKRKYRGVDILLVDDVQFIAGKESVQMEFFHTFNSLLHAGGQVVLTSDKPPNEITKLETRLRSRFEGGLIVDVPSPNFELRTAILLIKAGERGVDLPIEIAKSLAANFEDVRALEGGFLSFLTEHEKNINQPQNEIVSKIINKNLKNEEERKNTNPEKIVELVASHFDLKPSQIKGSKRKRQIARPRQLLMYVLRQELGLAFEEIGGLLGGRDHSTIIHGVENISALLPKNENLRNNLTQIRRILWG